MRLLPRLLSLAILLPSPAQAAESPRSAAVECRPRGGTPNILGRLRQTGSDEIRIAYLGGSITAAPGWRVKSLAWLRERFPAAEFSEINAAIGGTGSDLGVFRLGQDVLRHRPDLLFVEFAVNDGGAQPERIQRAMEGIVRQTWEKLEKASPAGKSIPHEPGDPLRPDHWAKAKLVPISKTMLSGTWSQLDSGEAGDPIARRFKNRMPQMWRATEPGASLKFQFRGTMAGLYDILGPDGGQLMVKLDQAPQRAINRIDGYCTYHRLATVQLGSDLDPGTPHTTTITLAAAAPDKAAILFEKNRPDLEKNPAKYAANHWTAGSIMLLGDLLE